MQVIAGALLGFLGVDGLVGDGPGDDEAGRNELKDIFCICRPRPPIQMEDWSKSTAKDVMPKFICLIRPSF